MLGLGLCAILKTELSWFIMLQMCVSVSGAFADVIADALMVIQARRDKAQGSQDLQSLAWMVTGFGAVVGGLVAAYMTEYLDPYWCFGYYSICGFAIIVSACCLNVELETEGDFDYEVPRTEAGSQVSGPPVRRRRFCEEMRHNYHIVRNEFKMRLF